MKKLIFLLIFFLTLLHLYSEESYWHYYQLDFDGLGNCGPACVSMVYTYHTGNPLSIEEVNKLITYRKKDGATSIYQLSNALKKLEIPNDIIFDKVFNFSEHLYIISVDTKFILNREYEYDGGHYIVLFDYWEGWYKIADPLSKKDFVWYYEEDIEMALKNKEVIQIKKWKRNL